MNKELTIQMRNVPVVVALFGDEPEPQHPVSALMLNDMLDKHVPEQGRPAGGRFQGAWDGGHAWPGGQRGSPMGDEPSSAINATDLIWAFFKAHAKL